MRRGPQQSRFDETRSKELQIHPDPDRSSTQLRVSPHARRSGDGEVLERPVVGLSETEARDRTGTASRRDHAQNTAFEAIRSAPPAHQPRVRRFRSHRHQASLIASCSRNRQRIGKRQASTSDTNPTVRRRHHNVATSSPASCKATQMPLQIFAARYSPRCSTCSPYPSLRARRPRPSSAGCPAYCVHGPRAASNSVRPEFSEMHESTVMFVGRREPFSRTSRVVWQNLTGLPP